MALKSATRGVQRQLMGEFVASFNDTGKDVLTGAIKGFGTTIAENLVMDVINLPVGATIDRGELIIDTQGIGPTAYTAAFTLSDGTVLLAASSLLAAAGTAAPFTGRGIPQAYAGANVRLTMASTAAVATAGKFRVRVFYTIDGKADETVTN